MSPIPLGPTSPSRERVSPLQSRQAGSPGACIHRPSRQWKASGLQAPSWRWESPCPLQPSCQCCSVEPLPHDCYQWPRWHRCSRRSIPKGSQGDLVSSPWVITFSLQPVNTSLVCPCMTLWPKGGT